MGFAFTKLHGLGNDFIITDTFTQKLDQDLKVLASKVSDRHFGIGADGLIVLTPSDTATFRMRIFNADGSEAQMCGNGIRCAVKYAYEKKLLKEKDLEDPDENLRAVIESLATNLTVKGQIKAIKVLTGRGVLKLGLIITQDNTVDWVCVNMEEPILQPEKIPVALSLDRVVNYPTSIEGWKLHITCISMGNPHTIIFTDNLDKIDIDRIGPAIENHSFFPERTNVHFANVISKDYIEAITWERGCGRTLACGTGAAAICVAAVLEGRAERNVTVKLPGGELRLLWNEKDNCVYMLGPAESVFEGKYLK